MGELLGNYERLAARGIRPFRSINHGPTTSMYYVDPDGNRVELQIDNFATAEEGQAWMLSPAFDRNPIGVEFDPDDLVRRFQRRRPGRRARDPRLGRGQVLHSDMSARAHMTRERSQPPAVAALLQSAAATIHAELSALPVPLLEFHPARASGARRRCSATSSSARSAASRAASASS